MDKNLVLFFLIFILVSCSQQVPISVQIELNKMVPVNKRKFEKIFEYFSGHKNKQKLQASYFIVENINDFGFYQSDQLKKYDALFDVLAEKPEDYKIKLPWYSSEVDNIMDSLEAIYGAIDTRQFYYTKDVNTFTVKSFINYIDDAFKAWENPWCRHLSFQEFCEYILPYRNSSEELQNWRPMFLNEYSWVYDSVTPDMSMTQVAELLNSDAELKYALGLGRYPSAISPSNMLKARFGACSDMATYKSMVLKSFGVPVATDFLPQWGTDHNIHYWNAIMDENGTMVSLDSLFYDKNAHVAYKFTIAKVYRKTFSKQPDLLELQKYDQNNIPPLFKASRIIDVTDTYVPVTSVSLDLANKSVNEPLVYLCVFNDHGFTPIAYAYNENGMARFNKLGRGVIYFPLYVQKDKFVPAANSFLITKNGEVEFKIPEQAENKLVLTRKYHLHRRKLDWLRCLVKGKFEGANQADFSDAITLARIEAMPSQHFEELLVNNNSKYKYLRFVFDPSELELEYDDDGACIAEIEFIDDQGNVLKGIPDGTDGKTYSEYTPDKCFDGKVLTFFEDPRKETTGKWVGLSLDKASTVRKIRYIARNDLNCVQKDDVYELLYWDNRTFKSLGKQVAKDTFLVYNNCPENAIYWLRDLSGGKEERIFTYENSKQVWW